MSKAAKVWLIIAGSLVLVGCILFACVMATLGWDFSKLSDSGFETNTHEVTEPFGDISLTSETADIVFALSEDGACRVECREEQNTKHYVAVENGVLVIRLEDNRAWYDYIGFHFGTPSVTVYLPKSEYGALSVTDTTGNVKIQEAFAFGRADISLSTGNVDFCASASGELGIETSTGDINVKNAAVGSLKLRTSTGRVTVAGVKCAGDAGVEVATGKAELTDVSCNSFFSNGTTGDLVLKNLIAAGGFSAERTTGNVKFDGCDAAELYVKTGTGDVTGSLLSEKVFIVDTDTGSRDVPKTASGGRCEVITGTGDIHLSIKNR